MKGRTNPRRPAIVVLFLREEASPPRRSLVRLCAHAPRNQPQPPRDSVHMPSGKLGWPFEDKQAIEEVKPILGWIGGAKKVVADERNAVVSLACLVLSV